jgi:hypothetical protein
MKTPSGLVAMILLCWCDAALAADYAFRTNAAGETILRLSGPITPVDGAVFLDQVNRNAPRIVELEGPGGDVLSAVRIGVIIHERYMWTHAIGPCRSACAYIWIAGLHMLADEGVEIANHLPVATYGEDQGLPHQRGIALFGWYLGKLNISVDMMTAFLDAATANGATPNQYFDMLAFARYWNAPVEIVPTDPSPILANAERWLRVAEAYRRRQPQRPPR